MFNIDVEEITWGSATLRLETGRVARQADGAVLASMGETTVLATAVAERSAKPGIDFFPLTVNYQEKTYAAGKIPGGYFKREGRPTERETLISRLIDRPIRPLFVDGFRNETQVIATVLSYDLENDTDILALVASSAALTLSGIPFMGPIGAARVGYINGEYVLNPTDRTAEGLRTRPRGRRHAGRGADGRIGSQGALGRDHARRRHVRPPRLPAGDRGHHPPGRALGARSRATSRRRTRRRSTTRSRQSPRPRCAPAYAIPKKEARHEAVAKAKDKVLAALTGEDKPDAPPANKIGEAFKHLEKDVVRNAILDTGLRIDGRDTKTVRQIVAEAGVLPRTHGSALFTRGETQALVVTTLGTGEDEQYIDSLDGTTKGTFMLHYNFPPFSVGETGRMGATGRREIGHGKLAWRAIHPLLPPSGSVPLHDPRRLRDHRVQRLVVDGHGLRRIAVADGCGRAAEGALRRHRHGPDQGRRPLAVLSDILGDEDHLGDMDFKVAGTAQGVTSLQMDIKITGITEEIMKIALWQAKDGRLHILDKMAEALDRRPRQPGRACAAHRDAEDPHRQDPRSDRHRRQGHPRDRREDRRQDRHPGRRHRQGRLLFGRRHRRRAQVDQVASSRSRKSARSMTARSSRSSTSAPS